MAHITLKQLEAFVQVADLGSFRRAAERLNTTQPNISARIAGLEAQLGLTVMIRDAGSVRLTPRGTALLAKARIALGAVEAVLVAAQEDGVFEGILRLGVTEMIVHSWLGPYLSALKARFPNIDIDLTVDLSANLSEALQARQIDLALQNGPFGRTVSGMVALGEYPMVWVAAAGLGIKDGVLSLRDIAAHPILTHARGTQPFEQLRIHLDAAPEVSARLVPSTNISACLQMTREGLGVACLPQAMVREDVRAGRLRILRYLWTPDALSFYARYDAETAPHYVSQAAVLAGNAAQDKGN